RERPAQLVEIGPHRMSATLAMRKGHHAVDAWGQGLILVTAGDGLRSMRSAIAGRHHRNIVAGANPAVLADISLKSRNCRRAIRHRRLALREFVVEVQFFEREIVCVDVLSRSNWAARSADGLAVAEDHLPRRDRTQRDLVPRRNSVSRHQTYA